jgi:hypothetical protein
MRDFRIPLLKTGVLGTRYLPIQFAISPRKIARGMRLALRDLAPAGLPEAPPPLHFLVTPSADTRQLVSGQEAGYTASRQRTTLVLNAAGT